MKYAKFFIAAFAALGLAALFVPRDAQPSVFDYWLPKLVHLVVIIAMFALPLLAALLSVIKPPFTRWHAVAALAGFVLAIVKTRVWDVGIDVVDQTLAMQLLIAAATVGTLVSLFGLAKPESR